MSSHNCSQLDLRLGKCVKNIALYHLNKSIGSSRMKIIILGIINEKKNQCICHYCFSH